MDNASFDAYSQVITSDPTNPPVEAPSLSPTAFRSTATITLAIRMDAWPTETSFVFFNADESKVVSERPTGFTSTGGELKGNLFTESHTIQRGVEYRFIVYDSFGDGIQNGMIAVYLGEVEDNVLLASVENFTTGEVELIVKLEMNTAAPSAMDAQEELVTAAPSTMDQGEVPPGFCFSGETVVQVQGQGEVLMKDVKVGDRVNVGGHYERVYCFGHRDEMIDASFVQLLPSRLELSAAHMVFVKRRGPIPAAMLQVGDELELGGRIEGIRNSKRKGIYAPFTNSGTILVNGVKTSVYISLQESSDKLILGSWSLPLTHHWLNHSYQSFHRLLCLWLGYEDRLVGGISQLAAPAFKVAQWCLQRHQLLQLLLLIPFLMCLFLINAVEWFVTHSGCMSLASLLIVSFLFWRRGGLKPNALSWGFLHTNNYFVRQRIHVS